jgi:hypothetical protein
MAMTDPLIIAAPLLIAAIVMAVRFVGCGLSDEAVGPPLTNAPYSTLVLNEGLLSFWRLNEIAEEIAADSGDANNGTYQGTVMHGVGGLVSPDSQDTDNFAAEFDGTSGYVRVPFAENLNLESGFMVEVLVQPGVIDPKNRRTIVSSFNDSDQSGYILALNNADFEASVGTGADVQTIAVHANAQPNQAYYVAMTYDGTNLELYVNPDAETDLNNHADKSAFVNADPAHERYNIAQCAYVAQTKNELRIAASSGGGPPGEFFQGVLQDVAVYMAGMPFDVIVSHYWVFQTGSALSASGKPAGAGLSGSGSLSVAAQFPTQSAEVTRYPPASGSYDIPYWCTHIDLILLGGGGGGTDRAGLVEGTGGLAGSWTTATLQRGVDIDWWTTSLEVAVGEGGAAGTDGGSTIAGDGTVMATKSAAGGTAGASPSGTTGTSPGDTTYHGTYCQGGAEQATPGAAGIAPGGGGAGGALGAGGAGAPGRAWIVARQSY